jgi:hypothetical protein
MTAQFDRADTIALAGLALLLAALTGLLYLCFHRTGEGGEKNGNSSFASQKDEYPLFSPLQ